jgi:antitoxin component YwqK of YwqJK toxin-antitoxin module
MRTIIKTIVALLTMLNITAFATDDSYCPSSRYYFIGSDGEENDLYQKGDVYYNPVSKKPYNGKVIYTDGSSWCPYFSGNMKDGKLNGESKSFYCEREEYNEGGTDYCYESKTLIAIHNYKDGKLHGERKSFYESGKLYSVWNYKDGISEGKSFYENGNLQSESNYKDKNGERYCELKRFHENGKLQSVGNTKHIHICENEDENYSDGGGYYEYYVCHQWIQHGEQKTFDKNGNLIKTENYKDGVKQ